MERVASDMLKSRDSILLNIGGVGVVGLVRVIVAAENWPEYGETVDVIQASGSLVCRSVTSAFPDEKIGR
jgi:hypothetical protein